MVDPVDLIMLFVLKRSAMFGLTVVMLAIGMVVSLSCSGSDDSQDIGTQEASRMSADSDSSGLEGSDSAAMASAEAADVTFTDIDSVTYSLSEFKGSVVMVDFWRTDVQSCIERLAMVKELYSEFHDDGFYIFSVAMNRIDEDKLRLLRQRYKLPFPVVHGANQFFLEPWLLSSLPVSFLHDRDGEFTLRIVGMKEKEEYRQSIGAILRDSTDIDTLQL
jgi:peroxiredoxin